MKRYIGTLLLLLLATPAIAQRPRPVWRPSGDDIQSTLDDKDIAIGKGVDAAAQALKFYEANANGTDAVSIQAAASVTTAYTLKIPGAPPAANNYAWTVNTDGTSQYEDVSTSPGGADTQVQYNNSGAFGGDAGFTYNDGTNKATITGGLISPSLTTGALGTPLNLATSGEDVVFDVFTFSGGEVSWNGTTITDGGVGLEILNDTGYTIATGFTPNLITINSLDEIEINQPTPQNPGTDNFSFRINSVLNDNSAPGSNSFAAFRSDITETDSSAWATAYHANYKTDGTSVFSVGLNGNVDTSGSMSAIRSLTSGGTDDYILNLSATLNDTGAAGGSDVFRGLKIDVTETDSTGWDSTHAIDVLVDATQVFRVGLDGGGYFAGDVGIGIADPDEGLHVYGDEAKFEIAQTNGQVARFVSTGNWAVGRGVTVGFYVPYTSPGNRLAASIGATTDSSGLTDYSFVINTGNDGSVSEAVRINGSGNVGINDTGPTSQASIVSSATTKTGLTVTSAASASAPTAIIALGAGQTGNALEVNSSGGSGGDLFRVEADGAAVIDPSNIGTYIGASGGSLGGMKLRVDGGIYLANSTIITGSTQTRFGVTGLEMRAAGLVTWSSGANANSADLGLTHYSAGVLAVTDGGAATDGTPTTTGLVGQSGSGTDISGATLQLGGGIGTGTGTDGGLAILGAPAGTTGTSLNTQQPLAIFGINGEVTTPTQTGSATSDFVIAGADATAASGNDGASIYLTPGAGDGAGLSGNVVVSTGHLERSTATGLTASTTQTQAAATAITSDVAEFSTVANPNDAAKLPAAAAGRTVTVINTSASTLQLFPASGDDLGAGVDSSTTITTGSHKRFQAYDDTNWVDVT